MDNYYVYGLLVISHVNSPIHLLAASGMLVSAKAFVNFHILFEGLARINLAPRARGQNRRKAASATSKHQLGRG